MKPQTQLTVEPDNAPKGVTGSRYAFTSGLLFQVLTLAQANDQLAAGKAVQWLAHGHHFVVEPSDDLAAVDDRLAALNTAGTGWVFSGFLGRIPPMPSLREHGKEAAKAWQEKWCSETEEEE